MAADFGINYWEVTLNSDKAMKQMMDDIKLQVYRLVANYYFDRSNLSY